MSLIFFAQTMFGNMFAIRTLRKFRGRALISTSKLTIIGTSFAFIIAAETFFLQNHPRIAVFVLVISLIFLQLALHVHEQRRISLLLRGFPVFLDRWILNLRTGMSTTAARDRALAATEPLLRNLLTPLITASDGVEKRRHRLFSEEITSELRAIQNQNHNTITRLQNLRANVRRASDFRRKSGQAMRQSAIQSFVLFVMHFALAGFTFWRTGWKNADLILIATALTLAGALILRVLARRIAWTI